MQRRPLCKVYVFHDLYYHVGLRKIDINIGEGINFESNVVIKGPLRFNFKLDTYLIDCLVDFCIAWEGKYSIVHIDNEDDCVSVEHAVILEFWNPIYSSPLVRFWFHTLYNCLCSYIFLMILRKCIVMLPPLVYIPC